MPNTPANFPLELLMGLLQQKRLPMQASPELTQHLAQYRGGRAPSASRLPTDSTNVIDPIGQMGGGPIGARNAEPPPISRDPWFDEVRPPEDMFRQSSGPGEFDSGRQVLAKDLMRAVGIEPGGSYDRYFSQLMETEPSFVQRIARQMGLSTEGLDRRGIASLLADEFASFNARPY